MREIVLGTAGHVDHGKTSLVRALTGIETDRLKEEKKRGITIELGFAFLDLPCGHRLGIIDVPGHEKFVKNMVAGAAGIDLVAFVVAADEGVMPQTREHFEICSLLGVKQGLIIITKIDMVEPDWLEMVEEDIRDYFSGSFLEDAPLIKVSSTTGKGVDSVKSELDRLVSSAEFSEAFGPFRLPVDRIFSMKGFGAVVTGTSISGRIKVGEDVAIYPVGSNAKIRGIQVHGKDVEEVEAGHRTAINIQGLESPVRRGDVLATPNTLKSSFMLDCDFTYLSSNKKNLKNRARVRVHLGTAEIMGRLVVLDQEEAAPGGRYNVQLLLEEPVAVWPGDYYVARSYSPVLTIGGGVILNNCPGKKRRRFKEINREIFNTYQQGSHEDLAVFHLSESGFSGMTFAELEIRMGIFGKRLKKILNHPISSRRMMVVDSDRQWMVAGEAHAKLGGRAKEIVSIFHQENPMREGMVKEELRSRLYHGLDPKLFQLVLKSLTKEGEIVQDKAVIRMASHEVSLQEDAESLKREVDQFFSSAGLTPPTRKELLLKLSRYSGKLILEVIDLMLREEKLKRVSEDLYFYRKNLNSLQQQLVSYLEEHGEINAQGFKAMTGLSRKFSIPLLEYFDKQKLTIRIGDKRVLRG